MKLAVKVLKVVFSMGLIYLAGEYYGKSVAEVYLELTDPKRKWYNLLCCLKKKRGILLCLQKQF